MSQPWETYTTLRLNGESYSRQELLLCSKDKLKNSKNPEWEKVIFRFIVEWLNNKNNVVVKTSGSTGNPKNILIEKNRMIDSAKATNTFFDLDKSKKALLCLSADYIAGKMMIVRAFVGGFDLHYAETKSDVLLKNNVNFDFTAVVPLQLESVLKSENALPINRIKKIIVGGVALRKDLIQKLEQVETEVWATYGMTETITHIALQRLNGKHKTDYFQALPNIEFQLDERNCLRINAPLVSLNPIQTNDEVILLNSQQFRFLGRADFIINSGGIKLSPEILEQKMALYIETCFAFSSVKDEVLGERLVLVIESKPYSKAKFNKLNEILKTILNRFEEPKEIIFSDNFPRMTNGKLNRIKLKEEIS